MAEFFQFHGFEPSSELQSFAKEILFQIEEKSPGHSSRTATIEKTLEGYKGQIKISSLVGVFSAEEVSTNPKHLLDKLYFQIRKDLSNWNKNRVSFV